MEKLAFGTAGIRGIIGEGVDKINTSLVYSVTKAFAKHLIKKNGEKIKNQGVVIGRDNRKLSLEFSLLAAQALSEAGIKVYVSNDIQPTPFISFVVRKLKLGAAIIITASHNPAEYNGYKVYDNNGCQMLPDENLAISKTWDELGIVQAPEQKSIDKSKFLEIPKSLIEEYLNLVASIAKNRVTNLVVAFSPQHGTAYKFAPELMKRIGAKCFEVEEQSFPDPDFKNTKTPNPENPEAYIKLIEKGKAAKADIILTTDPDADRVGVGVRTSEGYRLLNGNETAIIQLHYILGNSTHLDKAYVVGSNVSTSLCQKICLQNKVEFLETPTGFKWIGNLIENKKDKKFIFGFEESYGTLINGEIGRDKDSLQSVVSICEIASELKKIGKNLLDYLNDIYEEYSTNDTFQLSVPMSGKKIDLNKYLLNICKNAEKNLVNSDKYEIINYLETYEKPEYKQPMVKIIFSGGSFIAIRPSGTEPKVKIYICIMSVTEEKRNGLIQLAKLLLN